jgi:hypothetical protein
MIFITRFNLVKLPQTDSFLKIKEILFLLHSKKLNYSTSM